TGSTLASDRRSRSPARSAETHPRGCASPAWPRPNRPLPQAPRRPRRAGRGATWDRTNDWPLRTSSVPRLGLAPNDGGVGVLREQVEVSLVGAARGAPAITVDGLIGGRVPGEELVVSVHPVQHVGARRSGQGVVGGASDQDVARRSAVEGAVDPGR